MNFFTSQKTLILNKFEHNKKIFQKIAIDQHFSFTTHFTGEPETIS